MRATIVRSCLGALLIAAALCASGLAAAAQPVGSRNAQLTWTAPTQFTDGTAIPASKVITYRVYRGARGSNNKVQIWAGTTLATLLVGEPLGENCYQLSAVIDLIESAYTVEGCKTMVNPTPNSPGGFTVAEPAPGVVAAAAYRMRQNVDGFEFVVMGSVPVGTACLPVDTVGDYCAVARDHVKMASALDTKPLIAFARFRN